MPRAVPSSSRRERRSSQFPAPGCASPFPIAASSHTWLAGVIMQFPSLDELGKRLEGDLDGCYDHPCVILSPELTADGVVTVLPMTSFDERHIQDKFPRSNQVTTRAHYLPVAPTPAHPDTGDLLLLRDARKMRKDSYVNTKRQHPGIPFAILRPFYGRDRATGRSAGADMALSAASYQLVIERAGFAAPLAPPAPPLRATAPAIPALERGPMPPRPDSVRPAGPPGRGGAPAPATRNPPHVVANDDQDFRVDMDRFRQSRPLRQPPPPSYGTVPVPAWSAARGGREASGSYSARGGAAGPLLPPGWVSKVVTCVLLSVALILAGYGVYWGAVKSIEMALLFWAWVKNGGGAIVDVVRGAWESVVGWCRRAVGSLQL